MLIYLLKRSFLWRCALIRNYRWKWQRKQREMELIGAWRYLHKPKDFFFSKKDLAGERNKRKKKEGERVWESVRSECVKCEHWTVNKCGKSSHVSRWCQCRSYVCVEHCLSDWVRFSPEKMTHCNVTFFHWSALIRGSLELQTRKINSQSFARLLIFKFCFISFSCDNNMFEN